MEKLKLLIQKCDLISIVLRDEARLPPSDSERFRQIALSDKVRIVVANDPQTVDREIPDASFLLTENRPITAELLGRAGRLKLIQNGCLRHNAIDCAAARRAGVPVSSMAQPGDVAVAEHALMMMLALGKNLMQADRAVRRGEWRHEVAPWVTSTTQWALSKKTLGIVGLGEVGCMVAERARCFGMRVIYYNHRRYGAEDERQMNIEYSPLHELMAAADFVSIHIAHTPETEGLIGMRELAAMKPSAFLVNTARGAVVDQAALHKALADRSIRGAGLDVFADEPLPPTDPLTQLDNVILTPHVAGVGVAWDSLKALFANVDHIIRGEPLENVIN